MCRRRDRDSYDDSPFEVFLNASPYVYDIVPLTSLLHSLFYRTLALNMCESEQLMVNNFNIENR